MVAIAFPNASNGTKRQIIAHLMPMPIDLNTARNSGYPNVHFMRIGWHLNIKQAFATHRDRIGRSWHDRRYQQQQQR